VFTPRRTGGSAGIVLTLFEAPFNPHKSGPSPPIGGEELDSCPLPSCSVPSIAGAFDGVDGGGGAQRRRDVGQVLDVVHFDVDHHVGEIHRAVYDAPVRDVALVSGGRPPPDSRAGRPSWPR